jgi:hypothetical protein
LRAAFARKRHPCSRDSRVVNIPLPAFTPPRAYMQCCIRNTIHPRAALPGRSDLNMKKQTKSKTVTLEISPGQPLTVRQKREIQVRAKRPERAIDTSDIPELSPGAWKKTPSAASRIAPSGSPSPSASMRTFQSASFPGSPPPSSAPFRRYRLQTFLDPF